MKIILPIGDVPEGETVTKATGAKKYIVRKSISVYRQGETQVIESGEGVMFLMPVEPSGNINTLPAHKEVAWDLTLDKLKDYVREQIDLRDGDHK